MKHFKFLGMILLTAVCAVVPLFAQFESAEVLGTVRGNSRAFTFTMMPLASAFENPGASAVSE